MSDTRAFTQSIDPIGVANDESGSVGQTSPAWILTFVRWDNRDPLRTPGTPALTVRNPLVVENDCISVSVTSSKDTLTPSMNATLLMTEINYETAIAPGDFVFVNMLNWDNDARRVADAARAKAPINGPTDGFKGVFKVQSVRRSLTVTDPNSGSKHVEFRITGFAFTEFNNSIYFNPYLLDNSDNQNSLLFASYVGTDWKNLVNKKGFVNVQDIIAVLIQSFIGNGISDTGRTLKGELRSPNVHFFIPSLVGNLLGVNGAVAAKDVYNYLFGLQQYQGSTVTDLFIGMNPTGLVQPFGRFYYTPIPCDGSSLLKPEFWNQVKTWSILNQYTNAPLNEIYTCFRISPDNNVMPTLVFRQIPFTNEGYPYGGTVTRFMTLPRWKINPALIFEQDIGRDEAARVNFVQYFGRSTLGVDGADIAFEIAQRNYLYDIQDVQRSGLRPYVVTTQFDDPTTAKKDYHSPTWAKILGDCLIGSHLKMNGSILTAGIVDPIAVGDNLELDGTVYHIEQIVHNGIYDVQRGVRTFRTVLSLSNGIDISSSNNGVRYPEMTYVQAPDLRINDAQNNQILPGVSESQDIESRPNLDLTRVVPNTPFPQPNTSQGGQTNNGSTT